MRDKSQESQTSSLRNKGSVNRKGKASTKSLEKSLTNRNETNSFVGNQSSSLSILRVSHEKGNLTSEQRTKYRINDLLKKKKRNLIMKKQGNLVSAGVSTQSIPGPASKASATTLTGGPIAPQDTRTIKDLMNHTLGMRPGRLPGLIAQT